MHGKENYLWETLLVDKNKIHSWKLDTKSERGQKLAKTYSFLEP